MLLGWVGLIENKESVDGFEDVEGRVIQGDGLGFVRMGWFD